MGLARGAGPGQQQQAGAAPVAQQHPGSQPLKLQRPAQQGRALTARERAGILGEQQLPSRAPPPPQPQPRPAPAAVGDGPLGQPFMDKTMQP